MPDPIGSPATPRSKERFPEIRARRFDRQQDQKNSISNLLPRGQQAKLRTIATVLNYQRANSTIFSQGEDAHFIYSVAAGIVRVSRNTENGRRQVLALMLPGDLFGLPETGIYVNSAETVCPATLYRVPWNRLHEMMLGEPQLQANLLARIAYDLRQAQRRIMMLGQQNVSQRLASFLLDLVQHPDFYDARKRSIKLPLTRWDIGDYLGAAPETVIRAFAKMERQKLLRRGSSSLLEVDIEGLRRLIAGQRRRR